MHRHAQWILFPIIFLALLKWPGLLFDSFLALKILNIDCFHCVGVCVSRHHQSVAVRESQKRKPAIISQPCAKGGRRARNHITHGALYQLCSRAAPQQIFSQLANAIILLQAATKAPHSSFSDGFLLPRIAEKQYLALPKSYRYTTFFVCYSRPFFVAFQASADYICNSAAYLQAPHSGPSKAQKSLSRTSNRNCYSGQDPFPNNNHQCSTFH